MVGPSPGDRNRLDWIQPAIIVLVGVSAGLSTLVGDATLAETALVVLVGLLVGAILARIVIPDNRLR